MAIIAPKAGSTVLMICAGPTGLCLAQLLKLNGGAHMVLAANAGPKMELARKLACADEYVVLDRERPQAQWAASKEKYAYGFDVVIEASGSVQALKDAIGYVARGGTLLYYGVTKNNMIHHSLMWEPLRQIILPSCRMWHLATAGSMLEPSAFMK